MRYEEDKMLEALRGLPVQAPREGFEDRVLNNALGHLGPVRPVRRTGLALATAAGIVVAVAVAVQLQHAPTAPAPEAPGTAQVAEVTKQPALRMVDVLLQSTHPLDNASLTVELDPNLALDNYPDVMSLSWQTDLKAGANKLSLPVRLLDGHAGNILVTLQHGDRRQQLEIHVNGA